MSRSPFGGGSIPDRLLLVTAASVEIERAGARALAQVGASVAVVAFFASDEASDVNGAIVPADGGLTARPG